MNFDAVLLATQAEAVKLTAGTLILQRHVHETLGCANCQ